MPQSGNCGEWSSPAKCPSAARTNGAQRHICESSRSWRRHACAVKTQLRSWSASAANQIRGIAKAKQAGKYKGRKRALTPEQVEQIRVRVAAGEKKTALARELGVNRDTLYEALKG